MQYILLFNSRGILNEAALLHPLYGRHRSKMDGALTGS